MQAIELFRVMGKLALDKGEFTSDIKEADSEGKSLSENLSSYMEKAKKFIVGLGIAAGIKKVAGDIWNLAKETSAAGDRIDKQSQALGMSRKAFQEWDYILAQSGASIDSLGMSMKTMSAAIDSNSAETAAGLSQLGLSAAHLQSLAPEEQFETLVKAFQKMPAGSQKSALAMQLFGKNAQSLMPLLNSSSDSIDELRENAEKLGLIMSDEDVDASVAFGDALDDLSRTWQSFKMKIGAQFLPGFTSGLKTAASMLGDLSSALVAGFKTGDFSTFFSTLSADIEKLIPGLVDGAIGVVNGLFANADKFVSLAVSIVTGVGNGIINSLPILVQKLPGIINTIWNGGEDGNGGLKGLLENLANMAITAINDTFGTNIPSFEVIVSWVQNAWDTVSSAFSTAAEWVGKTWKTTVSWAQNSWTTVSNAISTAGEWIGKTWTTTVSWVQTGWAIVKNAFDKAAKWVSDTAHNISVAWSSTVDSWITTIKGWLDGTGLSDIGLNVSATVSRWIQRIYDWITNGISIAVNFFKNSDPVFTTEGIAFDSGRVSEAQSWLDDPNSWIYDGNNAKGLNYVPYDGYRAILHRGETVLNQSQGRKWRQGGGSGINYQELYQAVSSAVSAAVSNIIINMDGKQVGNAVTEQVSKNIYQAQFGRRVATL